MEIVRNSTMLDSRGFSKQKLSKTFSYDYEIVRK